MKFTGQLEIILQPEALEIVARFQDQLVLPEEQQSFIDLSIQVLQKRRRRLWWRTVAVILVAVLCFGSIFVVQLWQSNERLKGF